MDPLSAIGSIAAFGGNVMNSGLAAYENEKNRDYNRAMSSTSYRRAAADLAGAGLNRVLALGSPSSGSAPGMMSYPDFAGTQVHASSARSVNSLQRAQESAAVEQAALLREQQAATRASADKTRSEKLLVDEQILNQPVLRALQVAQTGTEGRRPNLVSAQTAQATSGAALNAQNTRLQSYEADKQSVVKRAYRVGGPILDYLFDLGQRVFSNAADVAESVGAGRTATGGTRSNPRGAVKRSVPYGRTNPKGGR